MPIHRVSADVPAADAGGVDENSARRDGPGLNAFANA